MSDAVEKPKRKMSAAQAAALQRGRDANARKKAGQITAAKRRRQDCYLEALERGLLKAAACAAADVSPQMPSRWRKEDVTFADREREAELKRDAWRAEEVEQKLFEQARSGHFPSQVKFLNERSGGRWKPEKAVVQHEGTVLHEIDAGPLFERVAALQNRLEERKALREGVLDAEVIE